MKTLLAFILLSVTGMAHADKIVHCAPIVMCDKGDCVHKGGTNTDELSYRRDPLLPNGAYNLTSITFLAASNPQCTYFRGSNAVHYVVTDWAHTKPDLDPPYGANWLRISGKDQYTCTRHNVNCRFKLTQ